MDPLLAPQPRVSPPSVVSLSMARLLQHPFTTLFTWCVIGVAIAMPLTILSLAQHASVAAANLESALDFTVFLDPSLSAQESQAIANDIGKRADVAAVTLISKEQGLQEFKTWSHLTNALEHLPENPLPATITVRPRLRSAQSIAPLLQGLKAINGVQKIRTDETWMVRFIALRDALDMLGTWLSNASIVAAVVVLLTVLHLDLRSRYYALLTRVPSDSRLTWLRKICLFEGCWVALVGSVIGMLLTKLILVGVQPWVSTLANTYHANFILSGPDVSACAVAAVGGVAIGLLAGGLSARV